MAGSDVLGLMGRVAFLVLEAAVLFLNAVGLPANWILLGLAVLYSWLTHTPRLGWIVLAILGGLALLGELLEFLVGTGYTARRGATRWGVLGAFAGGLLGAAACTPVAPPFGTVAGGMVGSFAGAALLEYAAQRHAGTALRAGRAAFVGKLLATAAKALCGSWMWCLLAYRLLFKH